jgi:mannose-6-phosphate isomerase-like protein (cupin superfamily)
MKKLPSKPDDAQVAAYLWGALPAQEALDVERYAATDAEFAAQLDSLRANMNQASLQAAVDPPAAVKRRLFDSEALLDDGVGRDFPPYIHSQVQVADFMPWIADALAKLAESTEDFECIPVGASSDTYTFLAKMCTTIPEEVHTVEIERVMLVDGQCDFIVGDVVHSFSPGDRYQIPLHVPHSAHNTSSKPCIFIVQRTTA